MLDDIALWTILSKYVLKLESRIIVRSSESN